MSADTVFLLGGLGLLLAVVLPAALSRAWLSAPIVLVGVGALVGLLPMPDGVVVSPVEHRALTEHLTELCVIVALMGVGLALDRPLSWRNLGSFRKWAPTWKLLALGMPLAIALGAFLGWWVMGLAPAAALLLGAVLAPTDPVLAADVQVSGPATTTGAADDDASDGIVDADSSGEEVPDEKADEQQPDAPDEIDEDDEVRFALTSEAGLNDGLAFPFVYAAILAATAGSVTQWWPRWLAWDLVGRTVVGVVVGVAVGWLLARVAFRSRQRWLRMAENGEPLLAVAATLLSYGLAEVAHGWGFVSVFACAMTLRSAERTDRYHAMMHGVVDRLERLLTLVLLLLLGVALSNGLLADLRWQGAVVAALLVLVVRPVTAWLSLLPGSRGARDLPGDNELGPGERAVVAAFGVRGIGSVYYLAYATGVADFGDPRPLWSAVAFAIVLSVVLHGVSVTPAMDWLERRRDSEQEQVRQT